MFYVMRTCSRLRIWTCSRTSACSTWMLAWLCRECADDAEKLQRRSILRLVRVGAHDASRRDAAYHRQPRIDVRRYAVAKLQHRTVVRPPAMVRQIRWCLGAHWETLKHARRPVYDFKFFGREAGAACADERSASGSVGFLIESARRRL